MLGLQKKTRIANTYISILYNFYLIRFVVRSIIKKHFLLCLYPLKFASNWPPSASIHSVKRFRKVKAVCCNSSELQVSVGPTSVGNDFFRAYKYLWG